MIKPTLPHNFPINAEHPKQKCKGCFACRTTKENKNEKRQFKNTAERHKKQHRLATNKTVLTYMNTIAYRTILLYRRKTFCAMVLKGFAGCSKRFENAEEDLETQKVAERGFKSRRKSQKGVYWCKSGLTCIGSGAPCFLYGLNRGLFWVGG